MKQGRVRPTRQDIKDSKSIETKMIWKYLGAEPPFHCRRTLDQFGYPNLRSCEARDDDQMLWKRTRPKSADLIPSSKKTRSITHNHSEHDSPTESQRHPTARHQSSTRQEEDSDEALLRTSEESVANTQGGNVLMVDQLWLWALNKETIVTFFSEEGSCIL